MKKIARKIEKHLNPPHTTEPEVVYLMVEVRKLLEGAGQGHSFKALRLHCDWAVHTRLDGRLASEFLQDLDTLWRRRWLTGFLTMDERNHMSEVLGLRAFREDLKRFLADHDLPTGLM